MHAGTTTQPNPARETQSYHGIASAKQQGPFSALLHPLWLDLVETGPRREICHAVQQPIAVLAVHRQDAQLYSSYHTSTESYLHMANLTIHQLTSSRIMPSPQSSTAFAGPATITRRSGYTSMQY